MAEAPTLDFNAFIARQKESRTTSSAEIDGHDYSYVLDRQTRATFESAKAVELAVASTVRMYKQVWRGQLLGSAVRVSERQFPRIHRIAKECAETLGIHTPQLYIVNDPRLNAATYGTDDESFIMVHSALVDHYTDEELKTVIGHECGHIHNKHVVYLTTLHYLKLMAQAYLGVLVTPAMLPLNAWSRRAEITCDRAGMLCAKNDQIASRALAKLVLGSRKLYDEFDIDVFLEQYEEGKDSIGRYMEAFASHPYLPKRVLAMRAFGESELYRKHAGVGAGGLSMQEVDEKVKALLKGDG